MKTAFQFLILLCCAFTCTSCSSVNFEPNLRNHVSVTSIELRKIDHQVVCFTVTNQVNRTVWLNEEMIRWLPLYARFRDSRQVEWALKRQQQQVVDGYLTDVLKRELKIPSRGSIKIDCRDLSDTCSFQPVNSEHLRHPIEISWPVDFVVDYECIGRVCPMHHRTLNLNIKGTGIVIAH